MLQGHVFHSFLKPELRQGGAYLLSQFVGGMPPAIFLFLTGATLAFLMDSTERKGLTPRERVSTAFRRSGFLFLLAFAFRLQLWVFAQPASWTDLLRVDILNCMGFAIAAMSAMALLRTAQRARWCAVAGLAIALASPLVSQMGWAWVPSLVRNYIVPDYSSFSFFPWGAYLAFGMSAGSIIRCSSAEATGRAMRWAALAGASAHQTGRGVADGGGRISVDAPRFQGRLELGAAAWHHVAAGLLGAHRAGLRALAMVLQERPDGAGGHADGPIRHCADGGDIVHSETGAGARRLARVSPTAPADVAQPLLAAAPGLIPALRFERGLAPA